MGVSATTPDVSLILMSYGVLPPRAWRHFTTKSLSQEPIMTRLPGTYVLEMQGDCIESIPPAIEFTRGVGRKAIAQMGRCGERRNGKSRLHPQTPRDGIRSLQVVAQAFRPDQNSLRRAALCGRFRGTQQAADLRYEKRKVLVLR